jgi:hypothetical protein
MGLLHNQLRLFPLLQRLRLPLPPRRPQLLPLLLLQLRPHQELLKASPVYR